MKATTRLLAIPLFLICITSPAFSQETEPGLRDIHRSLGANRSLLARLKGDWARHRLLETQGIQSGSMRELENLNIKIKALEADRQILFNRLPQADQSIEMMKDLLAERFASKNGSPALASPNTAIASHAVGEDPVRSEMHFKALADVQDNRLLDAAHRYEEILLNYPDDVEAALLAGHAYLMAGHVRKAESAYTQAVKLDPENLNEITSFYENSPLENPNDDEACANLGFAYWIVGKLDRAHEAFRDALSLNPSNTRAQEGLTLLKNR